MARAGEIPGPKIRTWGTHIRFLQIGFRGCYLEFFEGTRTCFMVRFEGQVSISTWMRARVSGGISGIAPA